MAILLFCSSCAADVAFQYPTEQNDEVIHLCKQVVQRGTRRFFVKGGKITPFRPGKEQVAIPAMQAKLPDGEYYCGRSDLRKAPCAQGETQRIDGGVCSYQR
ncbi:MAG: hypothetical protein HQM11_08275 [SAR324 cluster bacterium]|nr:hypothetical protein [SAR324 cluster bacterium]